MSRRPPSTRSPRPGSASARGDRQWRILRKSSTRDGMTTSTSSTRRGSRYRGRGRGRARARLAGGGSGPKSSSLRADPLDGRRRAASGRATPRDRRRRPGGHLAVTCSPATLPPLAPERARGPRRVATSEGSTRGDRSPRATTSSARGWRARFSDASDAAARSRSSRRSRDPYECQASPVVYEQRPNLARTLRWSSASSAQVRELGGEIRSRAG